MAYNYGVCSEKVKCVDVVVWSSASLCLQYESKEWKLIQLCPVSLSGYGGFYMVILKFIWLWGACMVMEGFIHLWGFYLVMAEFIWLCSLPSYGGVYPVLEEFISLWMSLTCYGEVFPVMDDFVLLWRIVMLL